MSAAPPRRPSRARQVALVVVRVILTVAPLGYLYARVDLHLVAGSLLRASVPAILGCALLQITSIVVVNFRWRTLIAIFLPRGAAPPPVGFLIGTHLVAAYASFLPIIGAGEVARVWRTRHVYQGAAVTSFGVVAIERLVGLASMMLLGTIGWLGDTGTSNRVIASTLAVGAAGVAVLSLLTIGLPELTQRAGPIHATLARHPRLRRWVEQLPRVTSYRDLAVPFALSIVGHLFGIAISCLAFTALGEPLSPLAVLRVQPLLQIVMAIPITPAGVGQRELVFVTLFGAVGATRPAALGVALIAFTLRVLEALAGFIVIVAERGGPADPSAPRVTQPAATFLSPP